MNSLLKTLAVLALSAPAVSFGMISFTSIANPPVNTDPDSTGGGVGVTGVIDFDDYNNTLHLTLLNLEIGDLGATSRGYITGLGINFKDGIGFDASNGEAVTTDVVISAFPDPLSSSTIDDEISFIYSSAPNDQNTFNGLPNASFAALHPVANGNKIQGLDPNEAIRFLFPLTGSGLSTATTIGDLFDFDGDFELGFRFQGVTPVGDNGEERSTKLGVHLNAVPEVPTLLGGSFAIFLLLFLRKGRAALRGFTRSAA